MNNTKIVFVDLDGTLKNKEGKISERTYKIMQRLKDIGVYIIFTTGRSIQYTTLFAKKFDPSGYIITSNGAEIYNYINDNLIYSSPIKRENILFIDELINKYNLTFIANTKTSRYSNQKNGEIGRKVIDDLKEVNEEINQVVIQGKDIENMKLFRRDLESNKELRISNKSRDLTTRDYLFYDVTNSEVSKGNAIKKLCESLDIPLDKTMAIGDSGNDIEMFNVCNYNVAVANADEEVKKLATIETLSNDQDGVAIVLERLYQEIIK